MDEDEILARLIEEARDQAPEALARIFQTGARVVPSWPGWAYLADILTRYAHLVQAGGKFYVLDAPLSAVSDFAAGWNACSLPDGTLLFNHYLLNVTWTAAQGYARRGVDPAFDFDSYLRRLAAIARQGDKVGPPSADPYNQLVGPTAAIFRDMMAFVAAHEVIHYVRHHTARAYLHQLKLRQLNGGDEGMRELNHEHEFEADLRGMDLLAQTWSFDGRGALLSLRFMQYLGGGQPSPTHPSGTERFRRVQRWLTLHGMPDQI